MTGLVVLYFWERGGLEELVDNVFIHNLQYIGGVGASTRLEYCWGTVRILARTQMIVWAFALVGLAGLLISGKGKWCLFLAGWLVTSAIGVSASGYFFPHYFQQLLPSLALAAAAGAEWIAAIELWKVVPVRIRCAALCLVLAVLPAITLWPFWFTYSPMDAVRRIYPGNFFAEMPEFAQRLKRVTPSETSVFIFGAEPELLFYARRPSATRHIFLFPLYGPYKSARERQLTAAKEIERAQPLAAVYLPNGLFFVPGTDQFFTQWSQSYLQDNFYADTWLTTDQLGVTLILKMTDSGPDSSLTEKKLIGALFVRKPTGTP